MKKTLTCIAFLMALFHDVGWGQVLIVEDGMPQDSIVFDFRPGDTLSKGQNRWYGSFIIDTSQSGLWQIGNTSKSGFTLNGNGVRGIMTDTLNVYSVNQDVSFVVKRIPALGFRIDESRMIMSFTHRYETTAGKDGGLVEVSADSGATWKSVFAACNDTSEAPNYSRSSIWRDSFYRVTDTLQSGLAAFSGSSGGYIRSRIQLHSVGYAPNAVNATPCDSLKFLWYRFRFVSDSTADTLAGWNIKSITFETDLYEGVTNSDLPIARLSFSPNPSATGVFHLDDAFNLAPGQRYEVRNALGAVVISGKPERSFDLSRLPKGLYWIRIWGKEGSAVGKVVWE